MHRVFIPLILATGMASVPAWAEDSPSQPTMTKHQMMKECMAKQKASDGGMPKEDMKRACKDVTATELENEHTEKKEEAAEKSGGTPQT